MHEEVQIHCVVTCHKCTRIMLLFGGAGHKFEGTHPLTIEIGANCFLKVTPSVPSGKWLCWFAPSHFKLFKGFSEDKIDVVVNETPPLLPRFDKLLYMGFGTLCELNQGRLQWADLLNISEEYHFSTPKDSPVNDTCPFILVKNYIENVTKIINPTGNFYPLKSTVKVK